MTTIRFFFNAAQKDVIATFDGGESLTVGDLALCFEGAPDTGLFGDNIELAKQACQSVVDDFKASGGLLILAMGGELNGIPEGYELINVVEA